MSAQIPPGYDLSQIPSGPPPDGVQPNFTDPPSLGPAIIGVSATMIFLAGVFVTGRVIANVRKLGWSDYCCILALILSAAYTGTVVATTKLARHQWDVPLSFITPLSIKLLFAQGMLLGPCIFFAKISIFLLYFQLFTVDKKNRYLIYFGIFFTFLLYWTNVAVEPYFCAPPPGEPWDFAVGLRCHRLTAWGVTQGISVVILDLYIFILPIPIILKLHLPRKKKLSILFVFMTAAMGVVAGVAAMVLRILLHYRPNDATWYSAALFICIIVEDFIAIVVSCMPAFAGFIRTIANESAFFSSLRSSAHKSSQLSSNPERSGGDCARIYPSPSTEQKFRPYLKDSSYIELDEARGSGEETITRVATVV